MNLAPNFAPLILLAGGKSVRMGQLKGLLECKGEFWIQRQLNRFNEAGGTNALIVLGYDLQEYFNRIPALEQGSHGSAKMNGLSIEVLVNPQPELGQFSSIQLAAQKMLNFKEVFLLPLDVPAPGPLIWNELLQSHRSSQSPMATIPTYQDQGGHPIVLSSEMMKLIASKPTATTRLDHLIHKTELVYRLKCEEISIIRNLNNLGDWQRFNDSKT